MAITGSNISKKLTYSEASGDDEDKKKKKPRYPDVNSMKKSKDSSPGMYS